MGGIGNLGAWVRGSLESNFAWVPWVVWVHNILAGVTKLQGSKFWCWWNIWFYELLLWFYKVLLVMLVSSLYSLGTLYCNELSTQFTVFYINSYFIISMRRQNSKNQKIKSICKILLSYLFKILLNYLFIQ